MKLLIGVLMVLQATSSWAEVKDLTGFWEFRGQVDGGFKIENSIILVRSDLDRAKLENFRNQGFECVHTHSQNYKCKKISDFTAVKHKHFLRIQSAFEGRFLEITPPLGLPTLISEADRVKHWSVPAIVYTEKGKTSQYEFWELSGVDKAQFEVNGESLWLNLTEKAELAEIYHIRESVDGSDGIRTDSQYYYRVLFQK